MEFEIKYNGAVIATLEDGQTATLACNGKLMSSDIVITPIGTYTLTLKNTGDLYLYYQIDGTSGTGTKLEAGESVTLSGIKEFVYCTTPNRWSGSGNFTNCRGEFYGNTCTIYLTGENAAASVYSRT